MVPILFIGSGSASNLKEVVSQVTDPKVSIAGIYINPANPHYSALQVLELILSHRPLTPVFLVDDQNQCKNPSFSLFLEQANISGVVSAQGPFLEPSSPPLSRSQAKSTFAGFVALPLTDLLHLNTTPYSLFIEDESRQLRLFASAKSSLDPAYLNSLKQKNPALYVHESELMKTRQFLQTARHHYLETEGFPQGWQTAETLYRAKIFLKSLQISAPQEGFIEHAHSILTDVFQMISGITQSDKMAGLVEMAKDCDRNLHCMTLSILVCKQMGFEHNSIVEILGMASFFQDLSLYHTPFGNLSEVKRDLLPADTRKHYDHHPVLSADLLSKNTRLPEVTLQVIRQHHERRDRSGTPNRIGGLQLHPMAEVLSLINSYLDRDEEFSLSSHTIAPEIDLHYSERVTLALHALLKTPGTP